MSHKNIWIVWKCFCRQTPLLSYYVCLIKKKKSDVIHAYAVAGQALMTEVAKLVLKTNWLLLTGRGFHRSLAEISEESANISTAALHRCKKSTKADSMCTFLPLIRWEACWSPCHPAAWSPKAASRWGLQSTYSYPWGRKKKKKKGKETS